MVNYRVPFNGSEMVQEDLPYCNVLFNSHEGVLYNPQADGLIIGEFSKTFNPGVDANYSWDSVKLNWSRSAPSTPSGFRAIFTLQGILPDGMIDTIMEKIITTIPSSEVTEDIVFDLKNSRSMATLIKSNTGLTSDGKVMVNLPKRWLYYDSIQLNRVIPSGWTRMVPLVFKGASTTLSPGQFKRVLIRYDSDMRSDFGDLRFMDTDLRTYLCHNIDSKVDGSYAIITVQVPQVLPNPNLKQIYLVYGNNSATYPGSQFTSLSMGSDEPNRYQTVQAVDNFTAWDSNIWTKSVPLAGTNCAVDTGTTTIYAVLNQGVVSSGFSNCPIAYTPVPKGDWEFKIRYTTGAINGECETGIFMMNTRANAKAFKYWRAGDGNYYFQTPDGISNIPITGGAYWMKIEFRENKYYCSYSTDNLNWTTIFSSSISGFFPDYIGIYGHHWGGNWAQGFNFDDMTFMKCLGSESNMSSPVINPDSAQEDDTSVLFTVPSDLLPNSPANLTVQEAYHSSYNTPDILIRNQEIMDLSPSQVDQYPAIRLKTVIEADNTCSIRFNNMECSFMVV